MSAIGLFGKLPAHGDFVRRGGPAAAFAALDRWIEAEVTDAAQFDAFGGVRLAFVVGAQSVLATAVASGDAVARRFPAFALVACNRLPARDAAERWCETAATSLEAARDAGAAYDALTAAPMPDCATDGPEGWWRTDGRGADGGLPRGADFAAMLA